MNVLRIKQPISSIKEVNMKFFRSNSPTVFCKEGAFKTFVKFTEKHLCSCFCLKKGLQYRRFPVNYLRGCRKNVSASLTDFVF